MTESKRKSPRHRKKRRLQLKLKIFAACRYVENPALVASRKPVVAIAEGSLAQLPTTRNHRPKSLLTGIKDNPTE
jgi:hypothetical protein